MERDKQRNKKNKQTIIGVHLIKAKRDRFPF